MKKWAEGDRERHKVKENIKSYLKTSERGKEDTARNCKEGTRNKNASLESNSFLLLSINSITKRKIGGNREKHVPNNIGREKRGIEKERTSRIGYEVYKSENFEWRKEFRW